MMSPSEAWKRAVVKNDVTIRDAIQNLNENGLRISLIVESNMRFVGIVNDGDIRRGILSGNSISNSIKDVMQINCKVVLPGISKESVAKIMLKSKIQQIPIVNRKGILVGLHTWDDIHNINKRENLFVIMAGGKGVRLHPETLNCPKPMLKVAGKPILEHIIDRASKEGFYKFAIAIHHLGNVIEEYFGNGENFGVEIQYLKEENPLGTAGALSLIRSLGSEALIVTNGDVIADIKYKQILDFHNQQKAFATIAVKDYEIENPYGVITILGTELQGFEEKPKHKFNINAGIYIIDEKAVASLNSKSRIDMPTFLLQLKSSGHKISAYPIHENWIDIGRISDYEKANRVIDFES